MAEGRVGIQTLFGDAIRDSGDLARKELALLRAELSQNIQGLFVGMALIVVAAVFAIGALIWLTQALVNYLAGVLDSEALAALIVGGGLLLVAAGFGFYGKSKISSFGLAPTRSVRSIKRDAEVLTERVSG